MFTHFILSFRSLNRYDSSAILRNKQTNLFNDDDNGSEINAKKSGSTPPLPPTSSSSKTNRKIKSSKHKDENNVEDKKHRHHKSSHEKKEHAIDDEQEEKARQERRRKRREEKKLKEKNMQNEEEDFIESMKKLTTNNRRRRQESFGGGDVFETNNDRKNDEEQFLNDKLMPRKNSIVKIAFEQQAEALKPVESTTPAVKENHIDSEDEEEVKVDVGKQRQEDEKNIDNNSRIDQEYFKPLRNGSTIEFVLSPPPQGHVLNCKIIVNKGIFNEYLLYLEPNILIIKAHRRVASTKVYYVIDTINHEQDYYDKSKNCAKIISNMARNKFRMKLNSDMYTVHNNNILNIIFKSRGGEPRKILADAFLCAGTLPTKDKLTYVLKNRQPQYDVEKKKFVLNFNGRASLSSKNNFQIVDESAPDNILMQLGKEDTNRYNCDFAYPLCALQAFGFALGSLCK
jgi:hypothetical protein